MKVKAIIIFLITLIFYLSNCSNFFVDRFLNPDLEQVRNSRFISITGDSVVSGISPLVSFSISQGEPDALYELIISSSQGDGSLELNGNYPLTGSLEVTDLDISTFSSGPLEIRYRYQISSNVWSEWINNEELYLDREVSNYHSLLVFDDFKGLNTSSNSIDNLLNLFNSYGSIDLSWSSLPSNAISSNGQIYAPPYGDPDLDVVLTATMTNGRSTLTKDFNLTIPFTAYEDTVDVVPGGYVDVSSLGVQNSSSDSDIQSELQSAIDIAEASSDNIFIPAGTYLIENDIVPFDNLSMIGSPTGLTILQSATESQIMNLSQSTTGTKDNLIFKDLVFINVNFQFSASGETFDNIRFENCIFIMDNFTAYDSQLYCNDISQLEIINCAILIQGPDGSQQRGIYYYSSFGIYMEGNLLGYDSSVITEIQNYGSGEMVDKLPKLQWLEDQGYFSGDMRASDGDALFRITHAPVDFGTDSNNKVYNNIFFATGGADHISSLRLATTEIGGNYFHRDTSGRSVNLADVRNIVLSENYFVNGQLDIRSSYVSDPINTIMDIYVYDNDFDGMGIYIRDSDDQPLTVSNVILSNNNFIQGTEDITFFDINPSSGDYDLSAFTIDSANQFEAGGTVTVNTGTLTGTLNTPVTATISVGNNVFFNPGEYTSPVP